MFCFNTGFALTAKIKYFGRTIFSLVSWTAAKKRATAPRFMRVCAAVPMNGTYTYAVKQISSHTSWVGLNQSSQEGMSM